MTSLDLPAPYPLTWPDNKPRTLAHRRTAGTYSVHGYAEAMAGLEREVSRWQGRDRPERITDWQLTATHSGRGRPDNVDPGASLWFVLGGKQITADASLMVLACDKFKTLPHNVRALGLTMERLRLVADIGAYSLMQAVEGARALPPPDRVIDWRAIFGLSGHSPWSLEVVQQIYRGLAREAGEGSARLVDLNAAIEAARKELKPRPPGA